MCRVECRSSYANDRSAGVGLLMLAVVLVKAAVKVARVLVIFGAVVAFRWLSGAPMWGRSAFPVRWPRRQRAIARAVLTVPAITALWWPWPTLAALCATTALGCLVAVERRRPRTAIQRSNPAGPIRVHASVANCRAVPVAAVSGSSAFTVAPRPAWRVLTSVRIREES